MWNGKQYFLEIRQEETGGSLWFVSTLAVMIMNLAFTHLLEWPKSRTRATPNAGEDEEEQESPFTVGGKANAWPLWKTIGSFL
jgi:hypothetical protein